MADAHVQARQRALRRLDPGAFERLLTAVPSIAQALGGTGPLAPRGQSLFHRVALPAHQRALAELLTTPAGRRALLASLDLFHLRLTVLAVFHGGTLTRGQALAEVGGEHTEAVERGADLLAERLLAERPDADDPADVPADVPADDGALFDADDPALDGTDYDGEVLLRLLPDVAEAVGLPGRCIPGGVRFLKSERVAEALGLLGITHVASRKDERVAQLVALLSDPDALAAIEAEMPDDVHALYEGLLRGEVVDAGYSTPAVWHGHAHRYRPGRRDEAETALDWLAKRLLVWVAPSEDVHEPEAGAWLEAQVAHHGGLFSDWSPAPPTADAEPLADPGPFVAPAVARLEALLDRWAVEPVPPLADGGLGVRPVRAAAKDLGVDATEIALLAHLAVPLGLLGRVLSNVASGREPGRLTHSGHWCPTALRGEWSALQPVNRWALLVQAWLDATDLDERDGLPNKVEVESVSGWTYPVDWLGDARRAVLATLLELPAGTGLEAGALCRRAWWQHPALLDPDGVAGILGALRVLGLVPADGPVGLTELGRLLLTDVVQARARAHTASGALTVQADQTIMVPPEAGPDLVARVERYADLDADAGVRIYRLSERRIGEALAAGESVEDIEAFLDGNVTAPLPQNVRYLLHDLARTHGKLRAGTVSSYLRCEDPALLARAAGYKSTRLRVLAPTVAVSSLPRDKLLETLRARGLTAVAEDADGATVVSTPIAGAPLPGRPDQVPDPAPAVAGGADVSELAQTLFTTTGGAGNLDRRHVWHGS